MPELLTERLRLRPFIWADLDWLCELYSDPEVMRYLSGGLPRSPDRTAQSLGRVFEHWMEYGFGMWAVLGRDTGERLGRCGVGYFHDQPDAELSYTFFRRAWGRGYATEAAERVLRYAWEELRLPAVIAHCRPQNHGSKRVLEKLGMRPTGEGECDHGPALGFRIERPVETMKQF